MSDERRIHPRRKTHLAATLERGTDAVEGVVENVGVGGVFFAPELLDLAASEGDAVLVTLHVAPERRVRRSGSVLRADRYFDGSRVVRAFAIRFDERLDPGEAGLED